MPKFDGFGPEKILEVYNPKVGMHGFVVIDNTALGPGKGGIRMTPTISIEEVSRLARAMTWKCALAEIPFGGAKSGIIANPRDISLEKKYEIIEAFSKALKVVCPEYYISAPDMGTGENEMKVFAEANGDLKSCTGKPLELGGLPHELGSTGYGIFIATKIAAEFKNIDLNNATVAIEGFGNVGSFAVKYLAERTDARIVAVSDIGGLKYSEKGLDYNKLMKVSKEKGSVVHYEGGQKLPHKEIVSLPVDILITAAVPDLITTADIDSVKAKLIVEGSNIPMTKEVELILAQKGVLCIPDFVANAGGVISSYVEYIGGNEKKAFEMIEEKISGNLRLVLDKLSEFKYAREPAQQISRERVLKKCEYCMI